MNDIHTPSAPLNRVIGMAFFCLLLIGYLAAAIFLSKSLPISGLYVPDGVTLFDTAIDEKWLDSSSVFNSYASSGLLAVINTWLVDWGLFAPAMFNGLVLLMTFTWLGRYGARWQFLMPIAIPYYLASFLLPSKDIIVLSLFLVACVQYIERQRLIIPLLIAASTMLIRDGFGAILIAVFLFTWVVQSASLKFRVIALLALIASASLFWHFFDVLFFDSFIYTRSIAIAAKTEHFDTDTISSPMGYFFRLFGNATNLAFRPIFFDQDGSLHILSVFYWISGLTLLYAFLCCGRGVLSKDRRNASLGLIGLSSLIIMSVTPYVQPRYLLPICLLIPMFSFSNKSRKMVAHIAVLLFMSMIASAGYQLIGNYPPRASVERFDLPLY